MGPLDSAWEYLRSAPAKLSGMLQQGADAFDQRVMRDNAIIAQQQAEEARRNAEADQMMQEALARVKGFGLRGPAQPGPTYNDPTKSPDLAVRP